MILRRLSRLSLFLLSITVELTVGTEISLSDFQRILRTGLDNEIPKIVAGTSPGVSSHNMRSDQMDSRNIHEKRRSYIRTSRRAEGTSDFYSHQSSTDKVWNDLMDHAWFVAESIKHVEGSGLVKSIDGKDPQSVPFLTCVRSSEIDINNSDDNRYIQVTKAFGKSPEQSLLISSNLNETCVILTTSAQKARDVMMYYEGGEPMVAMPLLDIMKIHSGTIEEVLSNGWSVPFVEQPDGVSNKGGRHADNATDLINQWERMVIVDFSPGVGGMKKESELLEVVNNIMGDIQDMAEIGYLRRNGSEYEDSLLREESLNNIPAISEIFSITAANLKNTNEEGRNSRVEFWRRIFVQGIESEHGCSEMFSTLFVKPRAGYYSFDLVLNPIDGPPPKDFESSASNTNCVTSLLAALSVHPHVLSVKANFPIYHGWNIAQKLDSERS